MTYLCVRLISWYPATGGPKCHISRHPPDGLQVCHCTWQVLPGFSPTLLLQETALESEGLARYGAITNRQLISVNKPRWKQTSYRLTIYNFKLMLVFCSTAAGSYPNIPYRGRWLRVCIMILQLLTCNFCWEWEINPQKFLTSSVVLTCVIFSLSPYYRD